MQGAHFTGLYLLQACFLGTLMRSTDLSLFGHPDRSLSVYYFRAKLKSSKTISVISSADFLLLRLMLRQV